MNSLCENGVYHFDGICHSLYCTIIDNNFEKFITGTPSFTCTTVNLTVHSKWFVENQSLTSSNLPTLIIFDSVCTWNTTVELNCLFNKEGSVINYTGTTLLEITSNTPTYHSLDGFISPKNVVFVKSDWYLDISVLIKFANVDFCNRTYGEFSYISEVADFYWKNGTLDTSGYGLDFSGSGTFDKITTRVGVVNDLSYLTLIDSNVTVTNDTEITVTSLVLDNSNLIVPVTADLKAPTLVMDNSEVTSIRSGNAEINNSNLSYLSLDGRWSETISATIHNSKITSSLAVYGSTVVNANGSKVDIVATDNKINTCNSFGTFQFYRDETKKLTCNNIILENNGPTCPITRGLATFEGTVYHNSTYLDAYDLNVFRLTGDGSVGAIFDLGGLNGGFVYPATGGRFDSLAGSANKSYQVRFYDTSWEYSASNL